MNRCLQAPEILRLICDELPIQCRDERQRILAVALSCRALLEPALDRLWHKIHTFEVLRCNLPADVWKLEKVSVKHKDRKDKDKYAYKLLYLQRAITPKDLERYLTYYAPRIRVVHIKKMRFSLSMEAWQSLHLAVNWQSGALAPNATDIHWSLTPPCESLIPPEVLNQAWPYFTLFLGTTTSFLGFVLRSNFPIQVASLRNAAQHPSLRHLHIEDKAKYEPNTSFIDGYMRSFPWTHLQSLHLTMLNGKAIDHLATLPALKLLSIDMLDDVKRLHEYGSADYVTRPEYISTLSAGAFASLEEVDMSSDKFRCLTGVLQRLPPRNRLHTVTIVLDGDAEHRGDLRELLATMKYHCNRETLRSLALEDVTCPHDWEEDIDIDLEPVVDISPFFEFRFLEHVVFKLSESVSLTPEDISHIVASWPNLIELNIDVGFPNSRLPLLDHTDCLTLLYGCPRLEMLGLYFNASRITGSDSVPLAVQPPNQDATPAALVQLEVGTSPIYSPSKVAEFLRRHCPSLVCGSTCLRYASSEDMRSNVFNSTYEDRWHQVATELKREAT